MINLLIYDKFYRSEIDLRIYSPEGSLIELLNSINRNIFGQRNQIVSGEKLIENCFEQEPTFSRKKKSFYAKEMHLKTSSDQESE